MAIKLRYARVSIICYVIPILIPLSAGRPSGECYVELLAQSDLKRALEKNHNYLGQ